MNSALSWLALATGFACTWLIGRHPIGWLLSLFPASLWVAYDVRRDIPAGILAALVGMVIALRNWRVQRVVA